MSEQPIIEKLTPEQEAMLPVYEKKWLEIGLSTERANKEKAEDAIKKIYTKEGHDLPEFVWFNSPFEIVEFFKKNHPDLVSEIMDGWIYGNHEAHWLAFYQYFLVECKLECCKPIEDFVEIAKYMSWWLPYDTHCFCSEKPIKIEKLEDGTLHCENGPAIAYLDGPENDKNSLLKEQTEIYFLNGVQVSKELVMTPAEQLDPTIILKEKNAEIRREMVRKIGIERFIEKADADVIDTDTITYQEPIYSETETFVDEDGRTQRKVDSYVDKKSKYELLLVDIGKEDGKKCPFLKMENPSINTYHVEGVHPDCKTVKAAIEWRNGSKTIPKTLT